jgi:hypothetical protein
MQHIKIRICWPKMTKKNIQCSLAGLVRMTALRAQGRCGFDGVVGSGASWGWRRHGLGEDDGAVGPGASWVDGITGLGTASGVQCRGLGDDNIVVGSGTTLRAWGWCLRSRWHHRLGSGKMAARKGAQPWSGTTTQCLRGGLDDGEEAPGRTRRWRRL